jgi:hypothetical protein
MDVNEPPSSIMLSSGTVAVLHVNEDDEGASNNDDAGDERKWWSRPLSPSVHAFDVDAGQEVAFSIKSNHGDAWFQVAGVELNSLDPRIYVKSGVTLDYESRAHYDVTVIASDTKGLAIEIPVEVHIRNSRK